MQKYLLSLFFLFSGLMAFSQRDFYEVRVYEMKFGSPAAGLHDYLKDALLPALNRQGVQNIGVFEENGLSQPTQVYLLIPYSSLSKYQEVQEALMKDEAFSAASEAYHGIPKQQAPYNRYTTSFYQAFSGIPRLVKPAEGSMLFELRTYEGYSEDAFRRKVEMFNKDELTIFENTGLHSVFFGEKIAGPQMPCLTYMLAFKDMQERDENWAKFIADPDWNRVKALPEYADTVSNIVRVFLKPLAYSQL